MTEFNSRGKFADKYHMRAKEIMGSIPIFRLPKNTTLYHGTNATDKFERLHDRPSWFALSIDDTVQWQTWHQSDPRNQGEPRVLEFRTTCDLILWDMRALDARSYIERFTGEQEPSPYHLARSLPSYIDGWIAENEIMLVEPNKCVIP